MYFSILIPSMRFRLDPAFSSMADSVLVENFICHTWDKTLIWPTNIFLAFMFSVLSITNICNEISLLWPIFRYEDHKHLYLAKCTIFWDRWELSGHPSFFGEKSWLFFCYQGVSQVTVVLSFHLIPTHFYWLHLAMWSALYLFCGNSDIIQCFLLKYGLFYSKFWNWSLHLSFIELYEVIHKVDISNFLDQFKFSICRTNMNITTNCACWSNAGPFIHNLTTNMGLQCISENSNLAR